MVFVLQTSCDLYPAAIDNGIMSRGTRISCCAFPSDPNGLSEHPVQLRGIAIQGGTLSMGGMVGYLALEIVEIAIAKEIWMHSFNRMT